MWTLRTVFVAAALAFAVPAADAQTLRIAMTTSDVPTTGGIPDNGSEGGRFAGYTIYDALVNWDFTKTDAPAELTPALATEWHIDPENNLRWLFTLRAGVKYHDGTTMTAADIVWNLDRHLNKEAPQYDTAQAASYGTYTGMIASYEAIGDLEVAITTKRPFSMLPYHLSRVFIVSPTQYAKVGNWLDFQAQPAGTGPFKVVSVTRGVSIELERNAEYWDPTRIPKLEKLILLPIPDASTRVAALRSGQVDWIEVPSPDTIPSLEAAGFQIVTKPYLHLWSWHFNMVDESPLQDVNVRRAINYAVDREGMVTLLSGTAIPALGAYAPTNKYFGTPTETYSYDPEKAKAMLTAAGYGPDHPFTVKVLVPTAGSGNMIPVPMAEFVQQTLADVGVNVEYEIADWGSVIQSMRIFAGTDGATGLSGINHGQPFGDPTNFYSSFHSGLNWEGYSNPEVDALLDEAFSTFDTAKQDELIAKAHALVVDDAPRLFVVHDLNPRAMSTKVKGFVQAQSWYQDFTQVTVEP